MLRWLIGGGREPPGPAEKSSVQTIGEEQIQNPYTELLVLKGHQDIVRFLVQIDDYRFASAGDDGVIFLWNAQTGEKLYELHGHTHKITAIAPFSSSDVTEEKPDLIITASADRTVIVWDCASGRQVQKVSCFHSTVKCLTVLQRLNVWLSGGSDLCVWNRKLDLLCKTSHLTDAGISALVELPKNCVAAAVGKELIIFRLSASNNGSEVWNILEVKRLVDHQDNISSLVSVNDLTFVTGSYIGELIVWDALDWTKQASECNFWDSSVHPDVQTEIKLSQSPHESSVQHLASDDECVFAAVGKGIYVYNLQMKRVIACQRTAHDSSVLHIEKLPNRQLISCSEDGSVRIWELREKQQLPAEPVPTGFFNMWGFGRANKQANQAAKKMQENTPVYFLELVGDLIGHSSAVQERNSEKKICFYYRDTGANGLTYCGSGLVAAMGMRTANFLLSCLPPAHCYLASQSPQMFVCIRLLERAGDVKQSCPMLLGCYILLLCENKKLPEVTQQHCLTFHSRKGFRCQKVIRHENFFPHNYKPSVWLRPLESQA